MSDLRPRSSDIGPGPHANAGGSRTPEAATDTWPLRSFWMGGFEGADHLNAHGVPLDMAQATGHLARLDADYARAAALGLGTVRESIGWRLAETAPGRFDFSRPSRMAEAARRHGLQVVWTLMHYGTPPDVSLLDDAMIGRFAAFAAAAAEALAPFADAPPVLNLVNEIGFLAWAVSETTQIHPYRSDRATVAGDRESTAASGYEVKRRLARAVLAGIEAVKRVDPRARFLHVEPVVHVTTPPDRPDLQALADAVCAYQWQAWDLIGGRVEPGLGGSTEALDLIGVNHYHSGQWEVGTERRLWWHLHDPRRRPLAALLGDAHARYGRPLVIAETGHIGSGRAAWLHEVGDEVGQARRAGVPVNGICLYPLIDRPDWNDATHWHHSGLWDVAVDAVDLGVDDDNRAAARAAATGAAHGGAAAALEAAAPAATSTMADARSRDAPATSDAAVAPPPPAGQRRLLQAEYAAALAAWQERLPVAPDGAAEPPCLVMFPGHRWSDVHGRLEQFALQLAARCRVVVVEEAAAMPLAHASRGRALERPRLDRLVKAPGLELLVPRLPADAPDDADIRQAIAGALLGEFMARRRLEASTVWFETPMPLPLLGQLGAARVVYDCNLEPRGDAVSGAWAAREAALLRIADVVLSAVPRLHDRLSRRHANVHWVPDAVDAARFAPSVPDVDTEEADAVRRLQRTFVGPRLGYWGRIDAGLDLDLVDALAAREPTWQVVMVGALDEVDPNALPRRPNLHWLGAQSSDRLPHFAASWDVGLLPMALEPALRSASTPQALELLAAGRPVVATALPDLAHLYGRCLRVAHDADGFVRACADALRDDPQAPSDRALRAEAMLEMLAWSRTADRVQTLIEGPTGVVRTPAPRPAGTSGRPAVPARS